MTNAITNVIFSLWHLPRPCGRRLAPPPWGLPVETQSLLSTRQTFPDLKIFQLSGKAPRALHLCLLPILPHCGLIKPSVLANVEKWKWGQVTHLLTGWPGILWTCDSRWSWCHQGVYCFWGACELLKSWNLNFPTVPSFRPSVLLHWHFHKGQGSHVPWGNKWQLTAVGARTLTPPRENFIDRCMKHLTQTRRKMKSPLWPPIRCAQYARARWNTRHLNHIV